MPTRAELLAALAEGGADLPADLDDHTPLISSGVLDSTALFELALWVEERVAPGLDLTAFDLTVEWDTIAELLAFIERHAR
jgi:acyl carrier protein